MIEWSTKLFPLWALLGSLAAYYWPHHLVNWKPSIIPLLSLVMFGMGITLTWDRFRDVIKRPKVIGTGMALQYLVMPLVAFILSKIMGLSPTLTAGMVLVGSSSGGTASNVICYLAKGNVALSITLTMVSTVLAVLALLGLTWLYLSHVVPVPVVKMFISVLKIVLVPVVLGTAINSMFGQKLKKIQSVFPLISVIAIVVIIAIIVALNQPEIAEIGFIIVLAVVLHNLVGLISGYAISKSLKYDEQTCRTLAIEVGMQNSGLSVALAIKYFSAAAALPGAIFSIWHNLSGSVLASYWSGRER